MTTAFNSKQSSLYSLIFANVFMIFWAVSQSWDVSMVMWTYWCQSVIIGFFQFLKILTLKTFTANNLTMNDKPVPTTKQGKISIALFFAIHYGFFHLGYVVFLITMSSHNDDLITIWPIVLMFFLNHFYSFLVNKKKDEQKVKDIGAMMFFPYARIIPMHLTIVFGGLMIGGPITLIFFLLLKTIADVIMHTTEHKQTGEVVAHS